VGVRVLIAGGGTGGHLFPGIALAQAIVRRGGEASFVGSDYGIERTAVPRAGFAVDLLSIRGVRGEGLRGLARAAWLVPASALAAARILRRRRPELVVGVGGYASFPAVAAARLLGIPIVLLEQNSTPGLATRLLAPLAARICVSFPSTAAALGRRAVVTGNPVRGLAAATSTSAAAPGRDEAGAFRILVFGGSAGAHRLNEIVPQALARVGEPLAIVHQTGDRERSAVEAAYAALGMSARVVAFIDDMAAAYRAADLVVCRAGATTLAELTALGVAAILVPFPFATGDHQRLNAETLVDAGAAWMVLDRDLDPDRLAGLVRDAIADPGRLAAMRERARSLGYPDAAERVADECLRVAGRLAEVAT
jgi:UDP-N-acetylglucosamine--N-acetylmuramyl-(pentapeptide) pyrophosphoryl-undecaprenol N-acetylglucosamine transferase